MLCQEQLAHLDREGYLVVEDVLDPQKDLAPILDELSEVADGLAHDLVASGQLSNLYADLPFGKRLTRIIAETGQSHSQHFDFSLPKGQVGAQAPMYLGNALFKLITNSQLLDCVQAVIGPEIYSNPVQHARLKPPESVVPKKAVGMSVLVGETPWHQDNAVLTQDADATNLLTVWVPLVDTTTENGCLIVIPGSHRFSNSKSDSTPQLAQHCHSGHGVLRIPESVIEPHRDKVIPVPVKLGSVLIFHRRLWHASLPNSTDDLRTSLDLRYQPLGEPTGRDVFPGFVVRSSNPEEKTLENRDEWEKLWKDTQRRMSSKDYKEQPFDRWHTHSPLCA